MKSSISTFKHSHFQNHPDVELAICAYNATHLVPPDEEKAHLKECPDKKIAEVQKYNVPLPGIFFLVSFGTNKLDCGMF